MIEDAQNLEKPSRLGKIAGWIVSLMLGAFIIWNLVISEFKKWKVGLINQGVQIGASEQQKNINSFIVNQLKEKGSLRIMLSDPEGKTQEIFLRPAAPDPLNSTSTTP